MIEKEKGNMINKLRVAKIT